MSLHYLLDGYNILKQIPAFRDLVLEEGRRGLLNWIRDARPQGSVKNRITVVFDGNPDFSFFPGNYAGAVLDPQHIRVIFSDGCSADDVIKRMLDEELPCKNCVVVTNDKDVYLYARSLGARVMSVESFTGVRSHAHYGHQDPGGKRISLKVQEEINKEFFQRWLGEKQ